MRFILSISEKIDRINRFFAHLAGWLCLVLILITVEQVISRYFFNSSSMAMQEMEWHLFGCLFLLGSAYTLQQEGHVRVDLLYGKWSKKTQAFINCLGTLLMLLPICLLIIYYGTTQALETALDYHNPKALDHFSAIYFNQESSAYHFFSTIELALRKTLLIGEISPDPGGLEARWFIKSMIPFGFLLLALQGLSELFKNVITLFSKSPSSQDS